VSLRELRGEKKSARRAGDSTSRRVHQLQVWYFAVYNLVRVFVSDI